MRCINSDHARFQGVFFCKNGCLACELERVQKQLEKLQESRICPECLKLHKDEKIRICSEGPVHPEITVWVNKEM